jgi:hypothetical protein
LDQTPKPEVLPSPEVETPKVDEAKKSEAKSEQEPEELHQEKLPVPDRAVQERVLATVRDLFKGDYKDKAALATKLIHKAKETQDVVGRFVLLNEAKVLAAEAFQGELAIEAIDAMASEYAINGSEMKAAVLERAAKKPRLKPEQKMAIATAALQVIDEATGDDNYEVARKLVELADKVGRLSRNKQLIQDIVTKKEEVESMAKAYDDVAKAMDVLKDRPQDADANLTAGKYLCVVKSRWKKGLPMLALGIDEKLRAAAKMDIAGAASTAEQVKLADLWWDLSKERAAYWYTQALPELDGPEQERVAKRMAQMRGRLTSPNGSNDIRKSMPQSR